jgi:hypothetical protein
MYRSTTLSYEYNEVPFLQAVGSAFLGFLVYLICITLIVSVQLAQSQRQRKHLPTCFYPPRCHPLIVYSSLFVTVIRSEG